MFSKVLTTLMFVCFATLSSASTFSSYTVFGDSWSDDGKGLTINPVTGAPQSAAYAGGRFSNGPVWTESLADAFLNAGAKAANFAVGGATANSTNLRQGDYQAFDFAVSQNPNLSLPATQTLSTFAGQIDAFNNSAHATMLGDTPLVSVLLGANDLTQGRSPIDAATDVLSGIQDLLATNSSLSFVVSFLPDLARLPRILNDPNITNAEATAGSQLFNATLETGLGLLEGQGVEIFRLDFGSVLEEVIANPERSGYPATLNITDTCLVPGVFDCTLIIDQGAVVGADPSLANNFLWIDEVHPSAPLHAALGSAALSQLDGRLPAVPVPAGFLLVLTGVAAFGVMRRRRIACVET